MVFATYVKFNLNKYLALCGQLAGKEKSSTKSNDYTENELMKNMLQKTWKICYHNSFGDMCNL